MTPPQNPRDLARSLLASESNTAKPLHSEPATVRVYERLRRQLAAPLGVDGFYTLASRALALAKSESPRLSAVQVTVNGGLLGLNEVESRSDADEGGDAGIALIAHLLGLFLDLLGEATTLRLIEDLRLQVENQTSDMTLTAAESALDRQAMATAFEDLLLEIDQLRKVSNRIEILADNHPGMEDGLISVAGSVRSIATVLDIFTLIRSNAGGSQKDAPSFQTDRYMN